MRTYTNQEKNAIRVQALLDIEFCLQRHNATASRLNERTVIRLSRDLTQLMRYLDAYIRRDAKRIAQASIDGDKARMQDLARCIAKTELERAGGDVDEARQAVESRRQEHEAMPGLYPLILDFICTV